MQEKTFDEEFHKFHGTRGSANIAKVAYAVATNTNSDRGSIGILLLWKDFANHFGVCDIISFFNRYVLVSNHNKCVSSCNTLDCTSRFSTNALTKLDQFIEIGLVPDVFIIGMMADMPLLKRLTSFFI